MKTKIVFQSIMEVDFPKEYKRINSIKWANKAQKERLLKLVKLFENREYKECYDHYFEMCDLRCPKLECSEAEFAPLFISNCFGGSGFIERVSDNQEIVEKEQLPIVSCWRKPSELDPNTLKPVAKPKKDRKLPKTKA